MKLNIDLFRTLKRFNVKGKENYFYFDGDSTEKQYKLIMIFIKNDSRFKFIFCEIKENDQIIYTSIPSDTTRTALD